MKNPPDVGGRPPPPALTFEIDRQKRVEFGSHGPKVMVIKRINSDESLAKVSPFLIKKVIDGVCGEVEQCKKIRSGEIMIKTKNHSQAEKLIKLTSLCPDIQVEVYTHPTLNSTKGVIYCNDLRGIPENEILQELKEQNVTEVKKILKKENNTSVTLVETGLLTLTFSTLTLPDTVSIGYEKINIRPYIPLPLRCKNCHRYGHITKYCRNAKLCPNCTGINHTVPDLNEKCYLLPSCHNCKENNMTHNNHSPYFRSCPIFIKQKEIQAIKTLQKVDHKTAHTIYKQRHQQSSTFANTLRTQTTYSSSDELLATITEPSSSQNNAHTSGSLPILQSTYDPQRNNTLPKSTYPNVTASEHNNQTNSDTAPTTTNKRYESTQLTGTKIKIFPKNTPNRIIKQTKAKAKNKLNKNKPKITNDKQENNYLNTDDSDGSEGLAMLE